MTCWRRLRDWQQEGVWDLMHFALLNWLARDGDIDWSRAVVDSCSVRAVCGGTQTGPNPTDRAKRGSKRHLICDAQASRSQSASLAPTGTTRKKPWPWSMRFRPCKANAADPGVGRPVCSATAAMMRQPSGTAYVLVTFCRCWRCAAPRTAAAWGGGGGCRADVRMAESIPPSPRPYDKRADIHEAFLSWLVRGSAGRPCEKAGCPVRRYNWCVSQQRS